MVTGNKNFQHTQKKVSLLSKILTFSLCLSMESVDQVGRRERFMQNNFESLSGGDDASLPSSMSNSISNAWRDGTGAAASAHQRNAGTIGKRMTIIFVKRVTNCCFEDTARRLRDAEQNRRREELQRRIEETRMKLQNVRRKYASSENCTPDTETFTPPMKCFHPSFNIQAQLFNFLPLVTNFRDTKT